MSDYKATATIAFPGLGAYLDTIVASLASHNLDVQAEADGHRIRSPFGRAWLRAGPAALHLAVEASDPAGFNRMKHDLTGLIDFVARPEGLQIAWTGDETGATLPPDLRVLAVRNVRQLTPSMRRITLAGQDLDRYAVPDQIHCRLLFPSGQTGAPEWPRLGDDGRIVWPPSGKLASRIYTIRRIDPAGGTLDIDFALHPGSGPGADWARAAAPGDIVGIVGPAAHGPKPADWYLLAGDETGLPGIARILEALPASARGVALIEVAGAAEEQPLAAPGGVEVRWLHRGEAAPGTAPLLIDEIRSLELPADRGRMLFWGGAEFDTYRSIRNHLVRDAGVPASRVVAYSHWRRGMSEEDIVEAGAAAITP